MASSHQYRGGTVGLANNYPLGSRPMAGRKVLVLEMRVRHLPPNHLKGGASMRHDRLSLVRPEDGAETATESSLKLHVVPASPDSAVRRLAA